MKDIITTNYKGQYHGYQELYWDKTKLVFRGYRKNDKCIGYEECYRIKKTNFYIR